MRCSNKDGPDVPPPSRPCLVQENGYVYARGQAFSSFGNKAFTASTTAMTFVPGCFEHENDGKGPVLPAGEFRVLRLLHNGRDVRKPDRGTVLLGHGQTLAVLGRLALIVVVIVEPCLARSNFP